MRAPALCLLPLLLLLTAAAPKAEFTPFTAKDEGFSILMPGEPKSASDSIDTPRGKIALKSFMVQAGAGLMYGVTVSDMPRGMITKDNLEQFMDGGRDGAVKNVKGKLVDEKAITLDPTHAGREMRVELPMPGMVMRSRFFVDGDRVYQLIVIGTKDTIDAKETSKALDSFKLLK